MAICGAIGLASGHCPDVADDCSLAIQWLVYYIWLFRGTPLLVQLIFWFNVSGLFRRHVGFLRADPGQLEYQGTRSHP